jgi:hypothetical protein
MNDLSGDYVYRAEINGGGGFNSELNLRTCDNPSAVFAIGRGSSDANDSRIRVGIGSDADDLVDVQGAGWTTVTGEYGGGEVYYKLNSKWGSDQDTRLIAWFSSDTRRSTLPYRILDHEEGLESISTIRYENSASGGDSSPLFPTAASPQQPGSEFWVEIQAGSAQTPVSDLFGTSFVLDYPEAHLSVVDSEAGSFLGDNPVFSTNNDPATGQIGVGVSRRSGTGGVDGAGTVARVKFAVDEATPGGTVLPFELGDVEANDPNGNPLALEPGSLEVEVGAGTAVWPGDTNDDGGVDQADVLPLGLHWGSSGPSRATTGCQWQAYSTQPWSPENATYADANGDGTVDQADVLCIGLNWGQSREGGSSVRSAATRSAATTVAEGTLRPTVIDASGETLRIGVQASERANLLGASFTLHYPAGQWTSPSVEPGPWMGDAALLESHVDETSGVMSVGVTRTAAAGAPSGRSGTVAHITLQRADGAKGATAGSGSQEMTLQDVRVSTAAGDVLSLSPTSVRTQRRPTSFEVVGNAPNPFRAQTTIRYALPDARSVRVTVHDVLGRTVATLVDGRQEPGRHTVRFDGAQVSSGLYFVRVTAGEETEVHRMSVVR